MSGSAPITAARTVVLYERMVLVVGKRASPLRNSLFAENDGEMKMVQLPDWVVIFSGGGESTAGTCKA